MKKRVTALLAGTCMVLGLAGCASKEISNEYITISEYKGVTVDEIQKSKVTEEQVDETIKADLQANAITSEDPELAVKNGDTITLDYEGKKDGVAFEGGTATGAPLIIGSGTFIPGFEEGVIGHKIGETFDLPITFPDPYNGNAELSGAEVVFTITVRTIQVPPELTDEFVKSVSEKSKTVEEYRKEVEKRLEKAAEEDFQSALQDAAWAKIVENTTAKKYPDDKVKKAVEAYNKQYEQMAGYYGMKVEDFITQQMGMTQEEFDTQIEEAAKSTVKQELAAELIAKKARLELSDKEYEEKFKEYAKQYGFEDLDALKKVVSDDELKMMAIQERVKAWVAEKCVQVEVKE